MIFYNFHGSGSELKNVNTTESRSKFGFNEIRQKFHDFYRNTKIRNKLLIIQILIVCIICLASLVLLYFLVGKYNNTLYEQSAQLLNISASGIENDLKKIEDLSFKVISDPIIQEYALAINGNKNNYERFKRLRLLLERAISIAGNEKYVSSIIFIDEEGDEIIGGRYPRSLDLKDKDTILDIATSRNGQFAITAPHLEEGFLISARTMRSIKNFSLQPLGTFVIRIDFNQLIRDNLSMASKYDFNLIVKLDDIVIYSNSDVTEYKLNTLKFDKKSGYDFMDIDDDKYFITYSTSKYSGFVYINAILYEDIFQMLITAKNSVLIAFFILVAFVTIISFKLAENLTKPIEELSRKMRLVENGAFELISSDIPVKQPMDEIGQLDRNFHIMIDKINTLIKEDHEKQLAIKDAQYKALQAQINPHFLYNTLESINWMAKMNGQQEISIMVESLGYLLRSSISKKEHIISVDEEIKILYSYITIQKMRYEDRLDFEIDIDEKYYSYYIPKLSFQPIVENAINHGLENMLETCKIKLSAYTDLKGVNFCIEDNGPGIDEDLLKKLKKGEVKTKGTGIGLKNIDQRIKMAFGEQYGIAIESKVGLGTTVIICIPQKECDNDV